MGFLEDEQAPKLVERFQMKRRGKNVVPKHIDFLKSILNITDRGILKQLDDIPLFETDSNFARVNKCIDIRKMYSRCVSFVH